MACISEVRGGHIYSNSSSLFFIPSVAKLIADCTLCGKENVSLMRRSKLSAYDGVVLVNGAQHSSLIHQELKSQSSIILTRRG